jgi:hypothetical protein
MNPGNGKPFGKVTDKLFLLFSPFAIKAFLIMDENNPSRISGRRLHSGSVF